MVSVHSHSPAFLFDLLLCSFGLVLGQNSGRPIEDIFYTIEVAVARCHLGVTRM